MGSKAGLTGGQLNSVLADLRVKFGQNVVEKNLKKEVSDHNSRFQDFFMVEKATCG